MRAATIERGACRVMRRALSRRVERYQATRLTLREAAWFYPGPVVRLGYAWVAEEEYHKALHIALWLDVPEYQTAVRQGKRWSLERYLQRLCSSVPARDGKWRKLPPAELPGNPYPKEKKEFHEADRSKIDAERLATAGDHMPALYRRAEQYTNGNAKLAAFLVRDAYSYLYMPKGNLPRIQTLKSVERVQPALDSALRRARDYWCRPTSLPLIDAVVQPETSGNYRVTVGEPVDPETGNAEEGGPHSVRRVTLGPWERPTEDKALGSVTYEELVADLRARLTEQELAALLTYAESAPARSAEFSYEETARQLGCTRRWAIELVKRARRKIANSPLAEYFSTERVSREIVMPS